MKKLYAFYALLALIVASCGLEPAYAGVASPCYWSSTLVKCFPSTGIYLDSQRAVRYGDSSTNYVEVKAPSSVTTYTLTWPTAQGADNSVLHGAASGAMTFGGVVSADITDGTIVNADVNASAAIDGSKIATATASARGVVYSSAWTSDTCTFSNLGSPTTEKCMYRRNGPNMEILFVGITGTVGGSTVDMTIPNSQTVDTGVVVNSSGKATPVGQLYISGGSTNTVIVRPDTSTSKLYFSVYTSMDSPASGGSFGSTTRFAFRASVPISGW